METLTFTATGDKYVSQSFVPNGDTAIELAFAEKGAQVFYEQSLSGKSWYTFAADYNASKYSITTVQGIVSELKLRVRTTIEPTSAAYVLND